MKAYRRKRVLDGVDLVVPSGSVTGFLGLNGAGKTTMLTILLGLTRPTRGEVDLFGHAMPAARSRVAHRIGAVLERTPFYPFASGLRNLAIFTQAGGIRLTKARAHDLIGRVGLEGAADKRVRTYSQGMRQRLALAVALASDPELLILDEPATGLDVQGFRLVNECIAAHQASGGTTIVSSHLMGQLERVCDRVAVLHGGRVVFQGSVEQMRANARAARMSGEARSVGVDPLLRREDRTAGDDAATSEPVAPSMEDLFLALTGGDGGNPAI